MSIREAICVAADTLPLSHIHILRMTLTVKQNKPLDLLKILLSPDLIVRLIKQLGRVRFDKCIFITHNIPYELAI
ncbi:MAG: hypothetical protein ABL860_06575 [Candidatus Nitrotoga sp.]